jgi:hypothetical protein
MRGKASINPVAPGNISQINSASGLARHRRHRKRAAAMASPNTIPSGSELNFSEVADRYAGTSLDRRADYYTHKKGSPPA